MTVHKMGAIAATLMAFACPLILCADTNVSGAMYANTTWTAAGSPYIVTGGVAVATAATLTIEPGVVVKFNDNQSLDVYGQLSAIGTSSQPISFTSSGATPVAGSWLHISFQSGSNPASRMSYVNIAYGGAVYGRTIHVFNASPQFDHVAISDTSGTGLYVTGSYPVSAPSFTDGSITRSSGYGVNVDGGSTVTLSNTVITDCGNYAVGTDSTTALNGLTGLVATGNGGAAKNAIENRGGTMIASRTWRASSLPWVVTAQVTVPANVTLTVDPGASIQFADNVLLRVDGTLTAVGTAAQPILFTSSRATPVAGSWSRLLFNSGASASRVSFATLSYGGGAYADAQLVVSGSSPQFDHLTISNSSVAGLYAEYSAAPVINNSQFINNASGIQVYNSTVDARLCYWGSDSGPSGSGPGTGQGVATGARFEPWLTIPPSSPQFVATAALTDAAFNPAIGATARLSFTTALNGSWTATITDASNAGVRTLSGSGTSGLVSWDGANDVGSPVPDGSYRIVVQSTGTLGEQAAPARARLQVDRTKQLTFSNRSFTPAEISPNGDGTQDQVNIQATASYENVSWTTTIRDGGGAVVRTLVNSGATLMTSWNGRDGVGGFVADGSYTAETIATLNPSASASYTDAVVVDTVFPVATLTAPLGGQTLSNVYQNGVSNVDVTGTASDVRLQSWTLEYSGPGQGWVTIAGGSASVVDQRLYSWATATSYDGAWNLRLTATDRAGNRVIQQRGVTIGNFSLVQESKFEINAITGGTISYTSRVPFPMTQTLVIKDASGGVVRTLFSGSRNAGTYTNTWDGKDAGAANLRDGAYFVTSGASNAGGSMTWDESGEFRGGELGCKPVMGSWDPFNNAPLRLICTFTQPGSVRLPLKNDDVFSGTCTEPGVYCAFENLYFGAGTRTFEWIGVDNADVLRRDLDHLMVISDQARFSKNCVLVTGVAPNVSSVTVTPPVYAPWSGTQTVSFSISSSLAGPYSAVISFKSMTAHSILRTVTLTGLSPGAVNNTWDGRADDGSWVAPGPYIVTVKVSDATGNVVQNAILTRIDY